LELLDQPANKIPKIFKLLIENIYKIPKFKSQIRIPSENGITDQFIKLKIKDKAGENKKIFVFAFIGNIISLVNNFKPSENGCNKPTLEIEKSLKLNPFKELCVHFTM
jgi:hypothetical protein